MPADAIYLKSFPCFHDLNQQQLETIAGFTKVVCYPKDHLLFEEGQKGDRLYFLVKGEVAVSYRIGEEGPVRVDRIAGDEIAGCSALVAPYQYTATERTLSEIEVIEVDAAPLRDLMREDLSLGFTLQQHIIKVLLDRIMNLRLQ